MDMMSGGVREMRMAMHRGLVLSRATSSERK